MACNGATALAAEMAFRPAPILTLFTLAALAVLIGLGAWQLQRMAERTAIFEQIAARAIAPDLTTGQIPSDGSIERLRALEFRGLSGVVDDSKTVALFGSAGRTYQRARLHDGRVIVAETGVRGAGLPVGAAIDGVLRVIAPDPDLPADDVARGVLFQPGNGLAAALGAPQPAVFFLAARSLATPNGASLANPRADPRQSLPGPERHLGYAATWYGLAIGLIAIYLLLHGRMGRFRSAAP